MSMTREEYLAKRRAYYKENKYKWEEYSRLHRDELNKKARERRLKKIENYRETARKWRQNNKSKVSEYQKKYATSEKGKENIRKYYEGHKQEFFDRAKKSRSKCHDEAKCHSIVSKCLREGAITKQPCEICGETNVDAHHDDYNKPLDIRWLCRAHHMEWHSKNSPIRANNTKQCAMCGKSFTFTHRAQKFCSDACRRKWNKEKAHQYYLDNIDKWHQDFAESSWCIENNITEEA